MITTVSILILFLILFVLSAFFSGSEMAFLSCNKLKLRHRIDSGDPAAKIIHRYRKDPKRLLATILIGNNLTNVAITSIFTYLLSYYFNIRSELIITLTLAPLLIIFCEIIPKDLCRIKADDYIYRFAFVLRWLEGVLMPLSFSILRLMDVLNAMTFSKVKRNPLVTKDEFRYVVEESAQKGVLKEYEKRLVHTILSLDNVTVGEVMTPLREFATLELTKKVKDVKDLARSSKRQVVLVYEEIPSIVVGIIYVFDVLFAEREEEGLKNYLRSPLFVPEDQSVEKTILLLQSKHSSYAAVTNADREVVGVVSIDNLIRF